MSSIGQKIQELFGVRAPPAPYPTVPAAQYKTIEYTAIVTVTVPANAAANSVNIATITLDPLTPATSYLQVNKGETWIVSDMFVTTAPSVDGIVRFVKNSRDIIFQSNPLSTYNVNNPGRPKIPTIALEEFSSTQIQFINLAAGGTSATTITFYLKLQRLVPVM